MSNGTHQDVVDAYTTGDQHGPAHEYVLVHHLAFARQPLRALELGSGHGNSTVMIAHAIKHRGGHLTSVDNWNSHQAHTTWQHHLDKYEVENVDHVTMDATEFLIQRLETGHQYEFIFHDAHRDNDDPTVLPRLRLCTHLLTPHGLLVAHDTNYQARAAAQGLPNTPEGQYLTGIQDTHDRGWGLWTRTTSTIPSIIRDRLLLELQDDA